MTIADCVRVDSSWAPQSADALQEADAAVARVGRAVAAGAAEDGVVYAGQRTAAGAEVVEGAYTGAESWAEAGLPPAEHIAGGIRQ